VCERVSLQEREVETLKRKRDLNEFDEKETGRMSKKKGGRDSGRENEESREKRMQKR
jgi:hypothetical protein